MVLKQQVRENIIQAIYSSSNICASTYDNNNQTLTIIFNNGGQYKYKDVSKTVYTRFELADSQGVVFNSHIKKHLFEKLDNIDTKELLNEVAEIKTKENDLKKKHYEDNLISSIKTFMGIYETTNLLNVDVLKQSIASYESNLKKDE